MASLTGDYVLGTSILDGSTPSRLVATDANSIVVSTDLSSWVASADTNELKVADDASGGVSISIVSDVANGIPTLDGSGLLQTGQFPAVSLTTIDTVASEVAQLALVAQEGDVAVRTDTNTTYIHNGGSAGDMTDWTALQTPIDQLTASEITQLQNIDSTTISTAQWGYVGALDQALATTDSVQYSSITLADGSGATPSLAFSGSGTNSGMYVSGTSIYMGYNGGIKSKWNGSGFWPGGNDGVYWSDANTMTILTGSSLSLAGGDFNITAGNLDVVGTLSCDTSITVDSTTLTTAELGVLDGVVPGTVSASKAVVVDSNSDITGIADITSTGVLTMPNGSVGTPSINFGDSNSGFYGGANALYGSVNGALSFLVDFSNTNTLLGYGITNPSTGNNNVVVGALAGQTALTGSNNVYLGPGAGWAGIAGSSNQLVIANSNTSTPLIHGDFSASTLTVNGTATFTGSLSNNSNVVLGNSTHSGTGYRCWIAGGITKATTDDAPILALSSSDIPEDDPLIMAFDLECNATAGSRTGSIQITEFSTGDVRGLILQPDGGNLGINTTPSTAKLQIDGTSSTNADVMSIGGTVSAGSWLRGLAVSPFLAPGTTGQNTYGLTVQPTFTSTIGTIGGSWGLYVAPTHNGTGTTTTAYGVYIDAVAKTAGTITTAYGLYVNEPTAGGTNYCAYFQGDVGIGSTPSARLHVRESANADTAIIENTNESFNSNNTIVNFNCNTTGASTFRFLQCASDADNGGPAYDDQFILRGDGEAYCDGTWNGGGADYAEYFESTDGKVIEKGITLVLDNDKVRPYNAQTDNENAIIGVSRPKEYGSISASVGNSAGLKWTGKYIKDEWGVYEMEDFTLYEWEEKGETFQYADYKPLPIDPETGLETETLASIQSKNGVSATVKQKRKLNPTYDPAVEYIARSDRDEWILVGLVGQVPVKSDQTVNSRWVKMKEITPTVWLWLIR